MKAPQIAPNARKLILPVVAVAIAIAISTTGFPALAQPDGRDGLPNSDTIASVSDVYVDESFEAAEMLSKLRAHEKAGRWLKACDLVERILTAHAEQLVRVDSSLFESVGRRLGKTIAGWPVEGLRVYQEVFDPAANSALQDALGRRDVDELMYLLDRYFCTTTSRQIASAGFELAAESGDTSLAREICQRMLVDHPDRESLRAGFLARLAVLAALDGNIEEANEWLAHHSKTASGSSFHWLGRDLPVAELVKRLSTEAESAKTSQESFEWPVFGGNNRRNRAVEYSFDRMTLLWRYEQFPHGTLDALSEDLESYGTRHAIESGNFLMFHPVIGNGLIYLQDADDIFAIRGHTGSLAWHYRSGDGGALHFVHSDGSSARWFSPSLDGNRLYACMGDTAAPYYGYDPSDSDATVVCVDALTGEEIWRLNRSKLNTGNSRMTFDSSPLLAAGSVYVAARRRRTYGFEGCYVLRLRASDGQVLRRTHIGSASIGGFGNRRSTLSIPAMADGTIYVASNLGTIAALSTRTGRVQWLRSYHRSAFGSSAQDLGAYRNELKPWHFNPVICAEDRLVCLPTDASQVMVLDRRTGALIRAIDTNAMADAMTILGVRDGNLYGIGSGVFCYDLDAGKMVWTQRLPEDTRVLGRATLAGGSVLVPTESGVIGYDCLTGSHREQLWGKTGGPGNLLAMPDRILVSGNTHLSAYGRRADVWAGLRKMMRDRPDDPLPALDLSEIAFRAGRRKEAFLLLVETVNRAGGFVVMADESVRDRLFKNCLTFAEDSPPDTDEDRLRIRRFFEFAGQCAANRTAHLEYRFRFAEFLAQQRDFVGAVELYQQVLSDGSLREAPWGESRDGGDAGVAAFRYIQRLIVAHGRAVYARFDSEAAEWLRAARAAEDITLLDRITVTRPSAAVASEAMVAKGDLLLKQGKPLESAASLISALSGHIGRPERPGLMCKIAECYLQAGKPEYAWRWLTKALRQFPHARIDVDGKSLSLRNYRERFSHARILAETRRPKLSPPVNTQFQRAFDQQITLLKPLLPATPQSDWSRVHIFVDGDVLAFNSRNGELVWPQPAEIKHQPELLLATDSRTVLADRFRVIGLDALSGRVAWSAGERPITEDSPTADPEDLDRFFGHTSDGKRLVSFMDDGRAICIEVESGGVLWERVLLHRPSGSMILGDRWVAYEGVGVGSKFYCILDAKSGDLSQAIEVSAANQLLRMHITIDGKLVLVFSDGVQAFDVLTGKKLWRQDAAGLVIDSTIQFDLDSVIYAESGEQAVSLSLENGHVAWRTEPLPDLGTGRPEIVLESGQLIMMFKDAIVGIDAIDGRTLWKTQHLPGANLQHHFLTESYIVAVNCPPFDQGGVYTAYFIDISERSNVGRHTSSLTLGSFDSVGNIFVGDGGLHLQQGQTLFSWTQGPGD